MARQPRAARCCAPLLQSRLRRDEAEELATAFKAIADPGRLRLLSFIAGHAKWIAIFAGLAVLLAILSVVVLVVGILISLMQVMTPIAATLVTMFGMLVIAALLGWIAKRGVRGIGQAFESGDDG